MVARSGSARFMTMMMHVHGTVGQVKPETPLRWQRRLSHWCWALTRVPPAGSRLRSARAERSPPPPIPAGASPATTGRRSATRCHSLLSAGQPIPGPDLHEWLFLLVALGEIWPRFVVVSDTRSTRHTHLIEWLSWQFNSGVRSLTACSVGVLDIGQLTVTVWLALAAATWSRSALL